MLNFSNLVFSLVMALTPSNQFVLNNLSEPQTLDPHQINSHDAALLSMQLSEGLLGFDESYTKLMPAVAEKWEIKKQKTYVFHIRKGLKWSNGEPLTTEHVYGSFLRALAPETANSFVNWYTDNIVGAAEYVKNYSSPNKKEFEAKLGIKITGPQTIEIELKEPNAQFLMYMAQHSFFMIHPSMYAANTKNWNTPALFIGNGAYRIKTWEVNKKIVIEKNPNFREAASVSIPEIVALPISDENVVMNLWNNKEIDWTGENIIPTSLIASLRANPDFKNIASIGTYTYVLNVKNKPLDDVRVRRALSLAIHRAEITDKVLRAGQNPSSRMIPPGLPEYQPAIKPPLPFDRQIEQAKQLLADAGFPGGKGFPKLTLLYNTTEGHKKVAQAVQQMWKKYLGIDIELNNMEWKALLKEQEQKKFDILRQSWIGDIPDPITMLETYVTNSPNNYGNWSSPKYDALIREATTLADPKQKKARLKKIEEAEELLLSESPLIPIYHYAFFSLMSPRIKGFKPNLFGLYYMRYLSKN